MNNAPELLKADRIVSAQLRYPLNEQVWFDEVLPTQVITLLSKKSNLAECKNWRGIAHMSMVNKTRDYRTITHHVNILRIINEQSEQLIETSCRTNLKMSWLRWFHIFPSSLFHQSRVVY